MIAPFAAGAATDITERTQVDELSNVSGNLFLRSQPRGHRPDRLPRPDIRAREPPHDPDAAERSHRGLGGFKARSDIDVRKGIDPVAKLVEGTSACSFVTGNLPVNSVKELVEYIKAHAGFRYTSTGVGSIANLTGESTSVRPSDRSCRTSHIRGLRR
jgi:hypothetical protein